ncbi:Yip1 domain family protein [Rhizoctonia solani]|uniref:Yip1 domain family protein n=1 Tax=Rhizoctonia solani TaxID=456999 RepID=A0A8H7IBR2_9AGAM|nr:Yip1 domain family protein [Rhizoctonia solani]
MHPSLSLDHSLETKISSEDDQSDAPSRGWSDQSRGGPAPIWSIDYYQKWFDVDTVTVLARITHTMNPFSADPSPFTGPPASQPPLRSYPHRRTQNPTFTARSGRLRPYLSAKPFEYDFALLSIGVSLVYAYGFGTPFAVWGALRYLGTEWSIVEGIAVWGYAMAVWIPTAALCIIPIPILRWVLVGLAFGSSGWYITRNVYPVLASADQKPARLIIVALAILHAAIALTFKIPSRGLAQPRTQPEFSFEADLADGATQTWLGVPVKRHD